MNGFGQKFQALLLLLLLNDLIEFKKMMKLIALAGWLLLRYQSVFASVKLNNEYCSLSLGYQINTNT